MQIITVAIQKGGVGKTSTAAALAQAAAYKGKRALAIDLDPQANLSFAMGADARKRGAFYLLQGDPAADLIQQTAASVDVIAANRELITIKGGKGSARRLQGALAPILDSYDFIIIDTPSTAGELQYNALQASTGLIIPAEADAYNLQSIYQMADTARQIQKSNPALTIKGFIFTKYDGRATLTKQMRDVIIQRAAAMGIPFLGAVRSGIAVKEAAALQESLFISAGKSKPAEDYLAIYEAIAQEKN